MNLPLFMPAIAEIWLAVSALLVVLFGVSLKKLKADTWFCVAMMCLVFAMVAMVKNYTGAEQTFNNSFIQDPLSLTFKLLILSGAFVAVLLATPYFSRLNELKFEYPLLVLLSTVGMCGMVSATDFLSLYVSLELQSLALYVLASFRRDQRFNSEAGLKYFFLGALSSGILLYGISLLYGYAGGTSYLTLASSFASQETMNPAIIVGLVMVMAGIAFKVSAAPFHMWAPDVYQGASMPVTALFAMAPKVAAIGVLCRLVTGPFANVFGQTQQIIILLSVFSMAVGAFAAIAQKNVKRLMAYSSIGHVGFILVALAAGGDEGIRTSLFYTATYVLMTAGTFAVLMSVYNAYEGDERIDLLSGLAKTHPVMAACFAVQLLSMAGIPPMVGFFSKFYVFVAAVHANLTWLVILGVLFSVVSAYYYLRLIKVMYFDAPLEGAVMLPVSRIWGFVAVASAILVIGLLVYPQPLSDLVSWAAQGGLMVN